MKFLIEVYSKCWLFWKCQALVTVYLLKYQIEAQADFYFRIHGQAENNKYTLNWIYISNKWQLARKVE